MLSAARFDSERIYNKRKRYVSESAICKMTTRKNHRKIIKILPADLVW